MTPTPHILVGTPCYGGLVTHTYMQSVVRFLAYARNIGIRTSLGLFGGDSLITRSRNNLVSQFMDMPEATHLMFIDADIGFQAEAITRMLQLDEDVVAGSYPIKNIDWSLFKKNVGPETDAHSLPDKGLHFVGLPEDEGERVERNGFITAAYAGTGFMLIKRACFTRMFAAYPETKYDVGQVYPLPPKKSDNLYALFDCFIDPKTKVYLSEDFGFCVRWRKIGGKIWLDTETVLSHTGNYKFEGQPRLISG